MSVTPKLIICRGLPASGKTTWATGEVAKSLQPTQIAPPPEGFTRKTLRVNRDDIRAMLHNSTFIKGVTEEVVIAVRNAAIAQAIQKGWDVISDDTNLRSSVVRDLMKIAKREGAEVEFKDFLDVPLETCILRDHHRVAGGKSVGEDVIRGMHNRFIKGRKLPLPIPELSSNTVTEGVDFVPVERGSIPAVISDIDGTVFHNDGHRSHYDYSAVLGDKPKGDVIGVVRAMHRVTGTTFFITGRPESCRPDTVKQLQEHVLPGVDIHGPEDLLRDQEWPRGVFLLMRLDDDKRRDSEVKYEYYTKFVAPGYDIIAALEDRTRVVEMYRAAGVTCMQVAPGDF